MAARISDRGELTPRDELRSANTQKFRSVPIQIPDTRLIEDEKIVLTGRVQNVPPPAIPPSGRVAPLLDRNLGLAKKMIDYVHKRVMFSENYPNRLRPDAAPIPAEHLERVLEYVRAGKSERGRLARSDKFGVGNCDEMASMGLLCPDIGATPVERYEIADPGDHVFLVIGRDPNTNPNDPSTWNPETVICDPWANAYYPAIQIGDFLFDCLGMEEVDPKEGVNSYLPVIRLFNPMRDHLKPYRIEGDDSMQAFWGGRVEYE